MLRASVPHLKSQSEYNSLLSEEALRALAEGGQVTEDLLKSQFYKEKQKKGDAEVDQRVPWHELPPEEMRNVIDLLIEALAPQFATACHQRL